MLKDEAIMIRPVAFSNPTNAWQEEANRLVETIYASEDARRLGKVTTSFGINPEEYGHLWVLMAGWTHEGFRVMVTGFNFGDSLQFFDQVKEAGRAVIADMAEAIISGGVDVENLRRQDPLFNKAMKESNCGNPDCKVHGSLNHFRPRPELMQRIEDFAETNKSKRNVIVELAPWEEELLGISHGDNASISVGFDVNEYAGCLSMEDALIDAEGNTASTWPL